MTAEATGRAAATAKRDRRRRVAGWSMVAILVAGFVVLGALIRPAGDSTPLSVDNYGMDGARALAQVLGQRGVDVRQTGSFQDAAAAAKPGSTLALVGSGGWSASQLARLARSGADIVIVDGDDTTVMTLTGGTLSTGIDTPTVWNTQNAGGTLIYHTHPFDPHCGDADAKAAGTVAITEYSSGTGDDGLPNGTVTTTGATPGPFTLCYPTAYDPKTSGRTVQAGAVIYAAGSVGGHRVAVLQSPDLVTNAWVAQRGNAALALRALGRHKALTWYLPAAGSHGGGLDLSFGGIVPRRLLWGCLMALVAGLFAAFWLGRRLGPPVPEPLPVHVPASQLTRGLGRLYRRAHARGHAAAALRAAALARIGRTVGIGPEADRATTVARVHAASGRDARLVETTLYGPAPSSDAELTRLARDLDQLEKEVRP
ncbi:MAG: DUF4350 domain-containing protein [Bifidobacteriaceae bacterium]|jgi:hypothetical protein|nr:DUF4350 domain-containing protein [Bifidobacteriaceae bacterium]